MPYNKTRWSKPSHPIRQESSGGKLFRLVPPEPEYVAANCTPQLMAWLEKKIAEKKAKEIEA